MRAALLLLLLLCPALVHAQEVNVRVQVVHDGAPVAQARVQLGDAGVLSDSAGNADVRVAAGRHVLRIASAGLEEFADTVLIRADTAFVIELEEEHFEEEEIIVTSTRGERRIQDEAVKVEVVTREEVEEKLLMTPGSIAMLLNETSGLRVQETSPALGGAVIRVQGLRGRYTQLLSDGLPLYGGQAGSLGILQIPPMDLAQVEVIKGAASALYGASALGGAINLISRRPADETELMLNQTSRGGFDGVLWQADELSERFGYTALVSGHRQFEQDIDDDDWADVPSWERIVARPRLFYTGDAGTRAMLTGGLTIESRDGGGAVPGDTDYLQHLGTLRADIGFTARRMLGETMQLDLRGSGTRTEHDHIFGDVAEEDAHATGFVEASVRGQHGAHYWVIGSALQRETYSAQNLRAFDYSWWIPSLFVQDEVALSSRVTASLSTRLDHHSEYGTFVAPRASALLRMRDDVSLRMTAGTGYSAPTPFTEETEEIGLADVAIPRPLRAEKAHNFSADLNWTRVPIELNVSAFGSGISDALQTVERAGRLELSNVAGTTRTLGMEMLARFRREPFGVTASYTYVNATQPTGEGRREDVPLVPRHMAGLVSVYEVHGRGRIGLELYYTGTQPLHDNPYRDASEPYVIAGILVERTFGRVRVFLNMENLTDVRHTKHDPLIRRAATSYGRWTTDVWAPVDGRTFNGGLRLFLR